MEQAIEAIQEKESKRPIGFSVAQIEYSKNEETEISASTTVNNWIRTWKSGEMTSILLGKAANSAYFCLEKWQMGYVEAENR